MAYDDSRLPAGAPHHILLEGREQLTVSGVEEVESFDENTIVMVTSKGTLVVRGEDLHIEKLSLDGGDLKVEGAVDALSYEDDRGWRGGLLSRLFGIPVSTTHTKTSAIMGVGAVKRLSAINFGVVKDMVLTWVFTFPGCGFISFVMAKLFMLLF